VQLYLSVRLTVLRNDQYRGQSLAVIATSEIMIVTHLPALHL